MKFESFNSPVSPSEEKDAASEKKGSFLEKYKNKFKNLTRTAFLGGSLALAAISATEGIKNFEAYKTHIETESLDERKRWEDARKEIIETLGEEFAERIEKVDRLAYFRELQNPEANLATVSGFAELGISNEVLSKLWVERNGFYPGEWIENIRKIEFSNDGLGVADYGKKFESFTTVAQSEADDTSAKGNIKFNGNLFQGEDAWKSVVTMDYLFGHELAHSNDWENNRNLSRVERAELLLSVIKRMGAENHFRSMLENLIGANSYHSLIELDNDKKQTYIRATEHFAKMAEGYFATADYMRESFPEDFKIIDNLVNRGEEKFVPEIAEAKREKFIDANFKSTAME